jgi:hypothetical protein
MDMVRISEDIQVSTHQSNTSANVHIHIETYAHEFHKFQ